MSILNLNKYIIFIAFFNFYILSYTNIEIYTYRFFKNKLSIEVKNCPNINKFKFELN